MAGTAEKTDPALWDKVKRQVTRGGKGGKPGEWSARKAQLAVREYKAEGGGYKGRKSADNHLGQWQREDWGTRSGRTSGSAGERYLPRKARETLTEGEYRRTTAKKRADSGRGRQFSAQPEDAARMTTSARHAADAEGTTKAALLAEARRRDIRGRSRMSKGELAKALGRTA